MAAAYLASAALMGVLVVAVLVVAARGRAWYEYAPRAAVDGVGWPRERPEGPGLLARPGTWVVLFVATVLVAIAGVFSLVTDPGPATLASPGALAIGSLVLVYFVAGTYLASRDRGHSHAMAIGLAAVVTGVLFLLGVAVQLLG